MSTLGTYDYEGFSVRAKSVSTAVVMYTDLIGDDAIDPNSVSDDFSTWLKRIYHSD